MYVLLREHVVRPLSDRLLHEVVVLTLIDLLPLLLGVRGWDLVGVGLGDALHVFGNDFILAHHRLVVALAAESARFVVQSVVLLAALGVVRLLKVVNIAIEGILLRIDPHAQIELAAILALVLVLVERRLLLLLAHHALVLPGAGNDLLFLEFVLAGLLREAALVRRWLHIVDKNGVRYRLTRALGLHVV